MRKLAILLLFASGLLCYAQENAAKDAVERAVYRFGEAWAINDVDTISLLLAPEYSHVDPDGVAQNREQYLEHLRDRKAKNITNVNQYTDLNTRIYGPTAVITGLNIVGGDFHVGGRPPITTTRVRFTQVWVQRNGQWQRVAFQATREAPPPATPEPQTTPPAGTAQPGAQQQ